MPAAGIRAAGIHDTGNPAAGTKSTGPAAPFGYRRLGPRSGAGSDGPTRPGHDPPRAQARAGGPQPRTHGTSGGATITINTTRTTRELADGNEMPVLGLAAGLKPQTELVSAELTDEQLATLR